MRLKNTMKASALAAAMAVMPTGANAHNPKGKVAAKPKSARKLIKKNLVKIRRSSFLYKENPALDAGFSVAYSDELVKALQLG